MKDDFKVRGGVLGALPAFLAVAERRSFSAAAADLGISPSAVSQAVQRLEDRMGAPLLVRTTRSVNLTDLGARLRDTAGPSVTTAVSAVAALADPGASVEPSGVLRLNVPQLARDATVLAELVADYVGAHPRMRVDITVENRNVDIVREGFHAGIRLEESIDRDMVSFRLTGPLRFLMVASKAYLDKHGRPARPRDLVDHACIVWKSPTTGKDYAWELEERGRAVQVAVRGPVATTDASMAVACAERGLGIAYVAELEAGDALATGRLEPVLQDHGPVVPGLFLYYPRVSRNVRELAAFVACARARLAAARHPRRPSGRVTSGARSGKSSAGSR